MMMTYIRAGFLTGNVLPVGTRVGDRDRLAAEFAARLKAIILARWPDATVEIPYRLGWGSLPENMRIMVVQGGVTSTHEADPNGYVWEIYQMIGNLVDKIR